MTLTLLLLLYIAGYSLVSATCWNESAYLIIDQLNPSIPRRNGEFNPEGILSGPLYQLGDFRGCLYKLQEQYCLTEIKLMPADNSSQLWQKIQESNSIKTHYRKDKLLVGVCVPTQCSNSEVRDGFAESLSKAAQNLGISAIVTVNQGECQTKEKLPFTLPDYIVGFVMLSILLLVLCGSSYDAFKRIKECEKPPKTTGGRFLMCFSLLKNWQRLGTLSYTEDSKAFRCIQGIRFITMIIIMLAHCMFWTLRGPIENPEWVEESYQDFFRAAFMNGNAIMGTYLSISGFLLGYMFLKDVNAKGSFKPHDFLRAIGHRYLRLTPVYAIVVALAASWFDHLGKGPLWNRIVSVDIDNCRQNWWISLLYLNNYFNIETQCSGHTWYLAVDFQCYITSLLVMIVVWKYPKFAKITLGAVMFLWILIPFVQTYVEKLDPVILYYPETTLHLEHNTTYLRIYIPFHGNAGGYFVGVIFGYIYYHAKCTNAIRKKWIYVVSWAIWMTLPWAFFAMSFIFYQPSYKYDVLSASFYACTYKTLFGTGIAVLVCTFALGYGWFPNIIISWKPFQILGRLTYTIYLTHFCLQRLQAGATKEPVFLQEYSLFRSAFADIVIAIFLALMLCLCVEMPSSAIPKIFHSPGKTKEKAASNNNFVNRDVQLQMTSTPEDGTMTNLLDDKQNDILSGPITSSRL